MYNIRTFYRLLITQTLSMIGSGMTNLAFGIWIYTETGNTTPLLLVGFFFWMPRMFLGSFGGVLADRFNRRLMIMVGDAGQAIPTLLLLLSFSAGHFAVWQLYLAALLQALFDLIQSPAITASVTMLVPPDQRPRANAVMQVTGPMAGLLAPSLAGVTYSLVGLSGVLVVDLLTFVVAVVVVYRMVIPQPAVTAESQHTRGSMWREMRGGGEFLLARRGLFYLSLYFLYLNFVTNGIWRLMPAYLLALTDSEATTGMLLSISSAGLVGGGLLTILWQGTTRKIDTILPALMLAAVGLIVFGMVRSPLLLGLTLFGMMLPYKMTNALLNTIQQSNIPPDMQRRVFALMGQISTFAMPITYLVTGPLVDKWLEPAARNDDWAFAALVGSGEGAGMAIYIMTCGTLLVIGSVVVYALPIVRRLEHDLPNYDRGIAMDSEIVVPSPTLDAASPIAETG